MVISELSIAMVSSQSIRFDRRLDIELASSSLRGNFFIVGNLEETSLGSGKLQTSDIVRFGTMRLLIWITNQYLN
jgi:hypothetical protein